MVAAIVIVLIVRRWIATTGRVTWDSLKLQFPMVGGILHRFAIMQFTQSLGTLLSGGTPMVPAIEIASQSVTNQMISSKVAGIVQNVREGEPLWRSLESTGVISDLAVEMIDVGESTGALPQMLNSVAEFFEEDVQTALTASLALIEPAILIVMGSVVVVILIALYLPIFSLGSGASAAG